MRLTSASPAPPDTQESSNSGSVCFRRMVISVRLWRLCLLSISLCQGFVQQHGVIRSKQLSLPPLEVAFQYDPRSSKGFTNEPQPNNFCTSDRPSDFPSDTVFNGRDVNVVETDIETVMKKLTLYEVLDSSINDTREELKRNYYRTAKLSHPDARRNGETNTRKNGTPIPDFQEVTDAWRVLGDESMRRRYDRKLKAELFVGEVQNFADQNFERVKPAVNAVTALMDKIAVPFLRRTTATTWAIAQRAASPKKDGVASGVKSPPKSSLTEAFNAVVEASKHVSEAINSVELYEKAAELEQRAADEIKRANQIADELAAVTEERLFATLRSGKFALSGEEARLVFEIMEEAEEHLMTISEGRPRFPHTKAERDIDELQDAEWDFSEQTSEYEYSVEQFQVLTSKKEKAEQAEISARYAMERARENWEKAANELSNTMKEINDLDFPSRESELKELSSVLTQKQKEVRLSLLEKAQGVFDASILFEPVTDEDLANLRRKEIQLIVKHENIEAEVQKLKQKAQELQEKSRELEEKSGGPSNIPFYKKRELKPEETVMRRITTDD